MSTSLERMRQDEASVSERRNGYRYVFVEQYTIIAVFEVNTMV